ncbi:MAG: hypothetical protein E6H01_04430 [Bacillati bacterium ANGP1]|uniref:valine--tRNA ligase n=1 Tax=Candidatus Segetimicrobium genomatis TaxID=2569760 RepID=A0A537L7Z7_9BACT|nr:MAG: hypothetical protein E6H01_04430 [Terrabacteria group bacterium ANGP1]
MVTKTLPTTYDPRQIEMARYKMWMAAGYFHAAVDPSRQPFVIMLPLPNVTGELHIGHASTFSIQDVLIRWRRMQGRNALWQPGTDHAGIATQNVVEREIAKDGLTLQQLGREKFEQRVWRWKDQYGDIIVEQLKRMGFSCDWDRFVFTLDPSYSGAVIEAFVRLYNQGLIYRGKRMVNWCPRDGSAISDLEVEYEEVETQLWYVRYPGADGGPGITIATQRPETILADVAVAVHPDDDRYRRLVGTHVMVPLANRRVPIIADRRVDAEFGTGALKITPGHDPLDHEIGADHRLPVLVVLDPKGRLTPDTGKYAGMDRFAARQLMGEDLMGPDQHRSLRPLPSRDRTIHQRSVVLRDGADGGAGGSRDPLRAGALPPRAVGKSRVALPRQYPALDDLSTVVVGASHPGVAVRCLRGARGLSVRPPALPNLWRQGPDPRSRRAGHVV